jgi:hypothetical protein
MALLKLSRAMAQMRRQRNRETPIAKGKSTASTAQAAPANWAQMRKAISSRGTGACSPWATANVSVPKKSWTKGR